MGVTLTACLSLLAGPVVGGTSAQAAGDGASNLRIGVIALAQAISAVAQTPELAEPLPFTQTSVADVLDLDQELASSLTDALDGTDLETALELLPGVGQVTVTGDADGPRQVTFGYTRTVEDHPLALVHDDGDLRFGPGAEAGDLDVKLATDPDAPFVMEFDPGQPDPLLQVALVSRPEMDLSVDIETERLDGFGARQGFTEVDVTGGQYKIHRERRITMRDPNGRGVLTLEDLRYSTLPDLFAVARVDGADEEVDVAFAVQLPDSIAGGSNVQRTGTLTLDGTPEGAVWPGAADASEAYGEALAAATGLSTVDGVTSLAKYTGATLALQNAADVEFPNVAGSTTDLFAPGDQLLELLATAAVAQIRCGAAPGNPPVGIAAPGDAVYCSATTADGIGVVTAADWQTNDGATVVDDPAAELAAVGPDPSGTVRIDSSDGEPDVTVTLTLQDDRTLTARSMPHTVQDVVARIDGINEASTAGATIDLVAGRLDVDVALVEDAPSAELGLGNPRTLGALVGLTGLGGSEAGKATVTATDASYDVGFGIATGEVDPEAGQTRQTVLLPAADGSLVRIGGLAATAPTNVTDLPARVGFLGVTADLTRLSLGASGASAVVLARPDGETGPLPLDTLLNASGALDPDQVALTSTVTAGIAFTAKEQPLPGGGFATGGSSAAIGTADITWTPDALPTVSFDDGYDRLRVFDPVPAAFLSGTAKVTPGDPLGADGILGTEDDGAPDTMNVDVDLLDDPDDPDDDDLYEVLGVARPGERAEGEDQTALTEVARRLVAAGPACQNVTLVDGDSLTCAGLAPSGVAAFADAAAVELIVLGDPFSLRDGIIEGLAATLAAFDRLAGDNTSGPDDPADDQYTSTLPLVDLTPSQLAVERAALAAGLDNLSLAATEDESGTEGPRRDVSSAQELGSAVDALFGSANAPSLTYRLEEGLLGIDLAASAPSGTTLEAPLRFTVNGPGQVGSVDAFDVDVASTTTLAIDVAVATARPVVADATGTTSTATLDLGDELTGTALQAGIGDFTAATGSTAVLDVTVVTDFEAATGQLQTTRTTAGVADPDYENPSPAAVADLAVGATAPLHVHAAATDSSGGTGAAQPAPEAMQVKYAAEGLDGLATALEQAMDGAAPRNLSPDGAPVSAPLIGTDLDAGAGVPDILRDLTSALRTQLGTVAGDVTADALPDELEAAMKAAVDGTDGLEDITVADVSASVECTGDSCETCTTPEGGQEECTSVGPTGWETVSISAELTGAPVLDGKVPFDTGLPGLEVRSDKEVDTTTSWTMPITLELVRGVGPQVRIEDGDALELEVSATMPESLPAIVGYLVADLTTGQLDDRSIDTTITITPDVPAGGAAYDLFALYDGELTAQPTFAGRGGTEEGLTLDFETRKDAGSPLHLLGTIDIPWTPGGGYGTVTYKQVKMDVGQVAATAGKPFEVVDPYLAPIRDVVDVLRTRIPVVSDLSELGGGDEISLLSLLETLASETQNPNLTLAYNVIRLTDGVARLVQGLGTLTEGQLGLEDLADGLGTALTLEPTEVQVYEKCTQTVRGSATTSTRTGKPTCPTVDELAKRQQSRGVQSQTTNSRRQGKRPDLRPNVGRTVKQVSVSVPGFSLPFLADPNQIMDVLTGQGDASYFRLDLGTLAAEISYTQTFGPIMAGPVPISPFVGGSIGIEGRLAMGFDSRPQSLAVEALPYPGDVDTLIATWDQYSVIEEGFYLDDLDADGVDVPEVKLVATLEAGAGVSIGIVSAGLKGGITLTIGLDLNDPNDDGRLRAVEIRNIFAGDASCIFDVKGELEAFIAIFVRIWVLGAPVEFDFDLLRLGPWTLFEYGCKDETPQLVKWEGGALALTSGSRSTQRLTSASDVADEYEVRQFDSDGGAAAVDGNGTTTYEVDGFGRVQRVVVTQVPSTTPTKYQVVVHKSGISLSTEVVGTWQSEQLPTFTADGGANDDRLSFLTGETFDDQQRLITTPFSTPVVGLTGGPGNDLLVTGAADDVDVDGGTGDDSIDLGQGDDRASGGDGNDTVAGGSGRDDLSGGLGNDRIEGGPGADRADGGDGNDGLVGGPGRDVRAVLVLPSDQTGDADGDDVADVVEEQVELGFDSGDVLVGGGGTDTVDGGDGSDVVVGGDGAYTDADGNALSLSTDVMDDLFTTDGERVVNVLTEGEDSPAPSTVPVTTAVVPDGQALDGLCRSGTPLAGEAGGDFVTGGAEGDVVIGGNGPDRLDGGGGGDEVCGRAADDLMSGDGGDVDEGSNRDVMRGGTGDDSLDAGAGPDVVFGDDVDLFRDGDRVLDGSLGGTGAGAGADHLDGGEGDDVLSGGAGSDLVLGGPGDDDSSGEGRDTASDGGAAPPLGERLLACNVATRVVEGHVDLNGDLLAGTTGSGITEDDGRLAGLAVDDGVVHAPGGSTPYDGLLGADVVVVGGRVDLDRNGTAGVGDSGIIPLASMLATSGTNVDGDCILSQDGDDQLRGGLGSDFLGAGEGRDLALGGDGNDLAVGGAGTDVLLGGPHDDVLVGGEDDDHLQGEDGDDRLRGNEGDDDLVGGSDTSGSDDGQDVLLGARGQDVLVAENGALVSARVVAELTGDGAPAWADEPDVPAAVLAGNGDDLRFADSAVTCGPGASTRWVTLLASDGETGTPVVSPGTPLAYDELYGGFDCDWAFGSPGHDLVRGGQGDDVVEGGPGNDIVHGDAGDDAVVGGSSVDPTADEPVTRTRSGDDVADGVDTILGDGGPDGEVGSDLLLGDNATVNLVPLTASTSLFDLVRAVVATTPTWTVQLADVPVGSTTDDVIEGGGDTNTGDHAFGQEGGDTITTGAGDDYVEGNSGADTITTGAGDDDVIGGSSATDGRPLGPDGDRLADALTADPYDVSAAGVPDDGDLVDAGAGEDFVLGDNGRITHPSGTARGRDVAMAEPGSGTWSGADDLRGRAGSDRLYGQGDDDDIDAGSGDDYVEGNAAGDHIVGQDGDDVLIGGSSVDPTGRTPVADVLDTGPDTDGDDTISGSAGQDLVLGDNATVYESVGDPDVAVQLGDVVASEEDGDADAHGDDTMAGGPGADRMFGQGGDDVIGPDPAAEAGDDYVEGNEGADTIATGDGDDDVLGGSSATDGRPLGEDGLRLTEDVEDLEASAGGVQDGVDIIGAGDGQDVVLGDNGRITRPGGTVTSGPSDQQVTQPVRDMAMADASPGDTSGSDVVTGGVGHDVLVGQLDGGGDLATGDRLFGEGGDDVVLGDLGVVTLRLVVDGDEQELTTTAGAIVERVYAAGTLIPDTVVPDDPILGGPDLVRGGDGDDVLRLGGGPDLGNGDAGDDVVFGGAGDDALWGGPDHDRVFGGYGADDLDLKVRGGDPDAWADVRGGEDTDGEAVTSNGADLVYGGWGPDELQADVGEAAPDPGTDHLIDWVGAHNVYYVCDGAYGGGRVIRRSSPDVVELLLALARASGGLDVETAGSGAWYDLGLVERGDYNQNNGKSPEYPGNFTCEEA